MNKSGLHGPSDLSKGLSPKNKGDKPHNHPNPELNRPQDTGAIGGYTQYCNKDYKKGGAHITGVSAADLAAHADKPANKGKK
jgi:hypothetical protein